MANEEYLYLLKREKVHIETYREIYEYDVAVFDTIELAKIRMQNEIKQVCSKNDFYKIRDRYIGTDAWPYVEIIQGEYKINIYIVGVLHNKTERYAASDVNMLKEAAEKLVEKKEEDNE